MNGFNWRELPEQEEGESLEEQDIHDTQEHAQIENEEVLTTQNSQRSTSFAGHKRKFNQTTKDSNIPSLPKRRKLNNGEQEPEPTQDIVTTVVKAVLHPVSAISRMISSWFEPSPTEQWNDFYKSYETKSESEKSLDAKLWELVEKKLWSGLNLNIFEFQLGGSHLSEKLLNFTEGQNFLLNNINRKDSEGKTLFTFSAMRDLNLF
ncbi:hypothetical protein [Candidatus Berkiella aquae]|uniref:Uncharacterized protein n=1 Tax=Candidatus Berkiella aquae TaxID=295108 RepID=A0A0Q9YN60_9GAMM|nr:hypothetical protein [Candidatus Berkiella aquae]MCS5712653.1 hypothetical protein [Candidatus Berkiella aquae]